MKNNVLITTTGEVCPIEGRLHLEKAALLLKSFNGLSKTAAELDPLRGDLGALDGKLDSLYTIEGYDYGASTFILLPRNSNELNLRAKEILEQEYNVHDTKPTGNVIISTLQNSSKDLIYYIERRDGYRRKHYPSLEAFKEIIYKERLVNQVRYLKFLEQHPEKNLPYHPDFFYGKAFEK